MPFGDRTGPLGAGPVSGRGGGFCAGQGHPGYVTAPNQQWFGVGGRGGRRGWRNRFYGAGLGGWGRWGGWPDWTGAGSPSGSDQEIGVLKDRARQFETALDSIRKRIEALQEKVVPK